MTKEIHDYLIALDISPKDEYPELSHEFVSELLSLTPSKVWNKGEQMGKTKLTYNRWHWRFSTPDIFFPESEYSFSEELEKFLSQLPSKEHIWNALHDKCDVEIYFPIERDYFQIEVGRSPSAIIELAKRKLKFSFSALFRENEN